MKDELYCASCMTALPRSTGKVVRRADPEIVQLQQAQQEEAEPSSARAGAQIIGEQEGRKSGRKNKSAAACCGVAPAPATPAPKRPKAARQLIRNDSLQFSSSPSSAPPSKSALSKRRQKNLLSDREERQHLLSFLQQHLLPPHGPCSPKWRLPLDCKNDLFCGGTCSAQYRMRRNAGKLRATLFQQERGVCRGCGVDCDKVFLALANSSLSVEEKSRLVDEIFVCALEKCGEAGVGVQGVKKKLVSGGKELVAGAVWQCDHVVEVRDGGGEAAGVSHVQTLCVFCHTLKTALRTRAGKGVAKEEDHVRRAGAAASKK